MDWKEKDLEDAICAEPYALELDSVIGQQLDVGSGIIDIVGLRINDDNVQVCVVELKRDIIDCAAVGQCARYVKVFLDYLSGLQAHVAKRVGIQGVLVAPRIQDDAKDLCFVCGFEYREVKIGLSVTAAFTEHTPSRLRLDDTKLNHTSETLITVKTSLLEMVGDTRHDQGVGDCNSEDNSQDSGVGTAVAAGEGER